MTQTPIIIPVRHLNGVIVKHSEDDIINFKSVRRLIEIYGYKTLTPCFFHQTGNCPRGCACTYVHFKDTRNFPTLNQREISSGDKIDQPKMEEIPFRRHSVKCRSGNHYRTSTRRRNRDDDDNVHYSQSSAPYNSVQPVAATSISNPYHYEQQNTAQCIPNPYYTGQRDSIPYVVAQHVIAYPVAQGSSTAQPVIAYPVAQPVIAYPVAHGSSTTHQFAQYQTPVQYPVTAQRDAQYHGSAHYPSSVRPDIIQYSTSVPPTTACSNTNGNATYNNQDGGVFALL